MMVRDPFKPIVFSIAKNLVLRECHHRDRLINVEHVEETVETSANYPFCTRDSASTSPEIHLQNIQLKELTEGFISALNDEERQFFSLRFAKSFTQEGTALKMTTTRARVKLLEKNMRKRFLDMLRKNGYLVEHRINPRWKRRAPSKIAA